MNRQFLVEMLNDQRLKDDLREIVADAVERRRHVLVYEMARQIRSSLDGLSIAQGESSKSVEDSEWIQVVSLSQLRSIVGGRFKNLRDRWVAAGFPLRAHRGDREEKGEVSEEAWNELKNWIENQDFLVRLGTSEDRFLFELKKLKE